MKKSMFIAPALALTILTGGLLSTNAVSAQEVSNAHAQPGMHQKEKRMKLTDSQRKEIRTLRQAAKQKMHPIKEQLFVAQEELKAMQNASNPDVQAVGQKAQEINKLRAQMQEEKNSLGLSIDKALGLEPGTTAARMKKGRHFAENRKGKGQRGRHHDQRHQMGME